MVLAPEHPLVDALVAGRVAGRAPTPRWTGGARDARPRPSPPTGARPRARPTSSARPRAKDKTGVFTGALRDQPGQRRADPGLHRRLRADGLRHRRDHGRARRRTSATASSPRRSSCRSSARSQPPRRAASGEAYTGDGPAINSANDEICAGRPGRRRGQGARSSTWLEAQRASASATINYKLRDWLFSRQRYWGEPFPIVYDEDGLPHRAARVDAAGRAARGRRLLAAAPSTPTTPTPSPEPPLARADRLGRRSSWTWATGRSTYRRETNTMPQWAGSCWYDLRYLDPTNDERVRRPGRSSGTGWARSGRATAGGVDLYVGGVEHAVLHLLYARFWHKVLFDLGHVSAAEPFQRLFNQGYIQAYAYTDERGVYVAGRRGRRARRRRSSTTGEPVTREYGQDGQEPEERRSRPTRCATRTAPTRSGCTRCRWARWTCRGRGRPGPSSASYRLPAAGVAQRRRRGHRRACGSSTTPADDDDAAGCCTARSTACATTCDGAALQHRDRQADRAEQPPDQGRGGGAARRSPSRWC